MSITQKLIENATGMFAIQKYALALSTSSNYTYIDLLNNISEYSKILSYYKDKKIDRVGIISKENIDFDTICLIFALIENKIKPIIINEEIGEQIKGILESEDIKIVFYESFNKPKYLKKYDVAIENFKNEDYLITVNPYSNVRNKVKMEKLRWYLPLLLSKTKQDEFVCKLYNKVENNIIEEEITRKDLYNYSGIFDEFSYNGCFKDGKTNLPLYKKQGFLFLTTALCKGMHVTSLDSYNISKSIVKILKTKPSMIAIDMNLILELITNEKFKNIDLSFVEKVVVDVEPTYYSLVFETLSEKGFNGSFITDNINEPSKIKKFKDK